MLRHLRITVDGRAYDVVVEDLSEPTRSVPGTAPIAPLAAAPSAAPAAAAPPPPRAAASGGGPDDRLAPLAGVVIEVNGKPGDSVAVDDPILVLEAMKMKTVIGAHKAGKIAAVHVKAGDAVDADQPLVTIQ